MSRSTSQKAHKKTIVVVPPKIGVWLRTSDEAGNCEDEHWIDSAWDREILRERFDELRVLLEETEGSPQSPQWEWSWPSRWLDDFRRLYFQFLDRHRLYSILVGNVVRSNTFDAVVEVLRSNSQKPKAVAQLKSALIDAALLAWPADRSRAAREIARAYSKAGLSPPRKQELQEELGKAAAETAKQSKSKPSDKSERLAEDFLYQCHPRIDQPNKMGGVDRLTDPSQIPGVVIHQDQLLLYNGGEWKVPSETRWLDELRRLHHRMRDNDERLTMSDAATALVELRARAMRIPDSIRLPAYYCKMDERWEPSPFLAVANGLLDLRPVMSGAKLPVLQRPSSCHVAMTRLPVAYDPEAKCPLWRQTLKEVLPSKGPEDRRRKILQEVAGWCLTSNELRLEKYVLCTGDGTDRDGANGKSVVLRTIAHMLGADNVSSIPLADLEKQFALGPIVGKLANICFDSQRVEKIGEGQLKQMTSFEPIKIEEKYKQPYSTALTAKHLYAANGLPAIGDKTSGMWRRLLAIPFLEVFGPGRADLHRTERLKAEQSGILSWAIAGLVRLVKQQQFSECDVCKQAKDRHRMDCDPVAQWIEDRITIEAVDGQGRNEAGELVFTSYGELMRDYTPWCERNHYRQPVSLRTLQKRLEAMPEVRRLRPRENAADGSRPRGLAGVRLRQIEN